MEESILLAESTPIEESQPLAECIPHEDSMLMKESAPMGESLPVVESVPMEEHIRTEEFVPTDISISKERLNIETLKDADENVPDDVDGQRGFHQIVVSNIVPDIFSMDGQSKSLEDEQDTRKEVLETDQSVLSKIIPDILEMDGRSKVLEFEQDARKELLENDQNGVSKIIPDILEMDGRSKALEDEQDMKKEIVEDKHSVKDEVPKEEGTCCADRNFGSEYQVDNYKASEDHDDDQKDALPSRLDGRKDLEIRNSMRMDDEENSEDYGGEENSDDPLQPGESFWCSLCDDGGNLLFCDGPCLRSFHACLSKQEREEGKDCKTLGFTEKQFKAIETELSTWLCPNCEANSQLCFVCGKLGKSAGSNQEVFNCDAAHCGQFYHPMCVAGLFTKDPIKQKLRAEKIWQGVEPFLCPLHQCRSCKELEDGTDSDMQFAKCRRCPRGWHIQCLPSTIPFEEDEDSDIPQRAWRVPVGDEDHQFRVGIYCPKHKLPLRASDMVRFPYSPASRFKLADHIISEQEGPPRKSKKPKDIEHSIHEKGKQALAKAVTKTKPYVSETEKESGKLNRGHSSLSVRKAVGHQKSSDMKQRRPICSAEAADSIQENAPLPLSSELKRRVDEIIARSQELKTAEEVRKKLRTPRYYGDQKFGQDGGKFIHDGELSSILNSIPKALNCLTNGSGIAQAKCLCPVKSISQLDRVERSLKVYLNPCLHGQRYTSFGRHFTIKEKLIEVVDRLQWYIDNMDMVVDFCCGANDFSIEVHCKLMKAGKKHCEFKNYDILAPKNNFQFEQRDWFTVQHNELPLGDRLVIGLNPPFGVRAAIANSFIDWAVTFKPKIIILIVPIETKRLEQLGYELIWADTDLLRGKSFYLPGSVKTDATLMEDWNKRAPPLFLWSRCDWADRHRQIALQHGHLKSLGPTLQQNNMLPQFQLTHMSCNPVTITDRPPLLELGRPISPWLGPATDCNMGGPSDLRPVQTSSDTCFPIGSTAPSKLTRRVQADWCHRVNDSPLDSPIHKTIGLPYKNHNQSPAKSDFAISNTESDKTPTSSVRGSPSKSARAEETTSEHGSQSEVSPCQADAAVELESSFKTPLEVPLRLMSKPILKSKDSTMRPLKADALLNKCGDISEELRQNKQSKTSHPSHVQEHVERTKMTLRDLDKYPRQSEKSFANLLHRGRAALDERRREAKDEKEREANDEKQSERHKSGILENTGDLVNRIDRRNVTNLEEGHGPSHRGDGVSRAHRRHSDDRGRVHEGEAKVSLNSKERSDRSSGRRVTVNALEVPERNIEKEPSARGMSQDSNDRRAHHHNVGKKRSAESIEAKASSESRLKKLFDESSHRNYRDFMKTTLCAEEILKRPKRDVFDAVKDHERRDLHSENAGNCSLKRSSYGREDAEKGLSRKESHGREVREKCHLRYESHGREDVERGQSRRGHGKEEKECDYSRTEEDDSRGRRRKEILGWEVTEKGHLRRQLNGREDFEKAQLTRDVYGREDVGKGHSIRDFTSGTVDHEYKSRISSVRTLEVEEDHRDSEKLGSSEKRNWKGFRGLDDDVDLESYRRFNERGPYCTGEEPRGLSLPKWFTTQASTGSLLEGGHLAEDVLPPGVEAEALETDTIKYPKLHGNYGLIEPTCYSDFRGRSYAVPEPSPPPTNFLDLQERSYRVHESTPHETRDSECSDFGRRNFGVHPQPPFENHTFQYSEPRPPGTPSFGYPDIHLGRTFGVRESCYRQTLGAEQRHQPQDTHGFSRAESNSHLFPEIPRGVGDFLTGSQTEPPLSAFKDEPSPHRRLYSDQGLSLGARDYQYPNGGGFPPHSPLSNDYLGSMHYSFPSTPLNLVPQSTGMSSFHWPESRPYLNF